MFWVARRGAVSGAAWLLVLGCGGRYSQDEGLSAGAGRTAVAPEGGAPNLNSGGAGNAPPNVAGAPSAGAPSAGAPSGGAPSGCQTTNPPPTGMPGNPTPQNVSGTYVVVTCGQATQCTQPGNPGMTRTLDRVKLTVLQKLTDLSQGTVSLHGTGEILLDDRPFDAKFTGRSFAVELRGPINAVCSEEYDLSFSYDFDGYGPRILNLDFERSPTCSGNNGSEYCKGNIHGTFGGAVPVFD